MDQFVNSTPLEALPFGKDLCVTIIGTGLIGGSMAIALKEKGFASKIIGVEVNPDHQKQALDLGLVDEINELDEAIIKSDFIIVSVPVSVADDLIISILDKADRQVVIDVGSTKKPICALRLFGPLPVA